MRGQKRILYIIERLSKEECTTKQLTQEIFNVDDEGKRRIVQNDIKLLKEFYGDKLISPSKGVYKFLKLPYFMKNITTTDGIKIKELIEFMMVFDNKMLSMFEKEEPLLIKKLRDDIKTIYLIHEPPLEILSSVFLEDIKRAIKGRRYVTLTYESNMLESYNDIQIHRIIYASGNWYIAIHDSNWEKKYNLLRINFIKSLKLDSKTFHRDIEIEKAVDNFQSLFSKPDAKLFEVVVEVSSKIMRHFKHKKHLKSQKIIKESKKGLTISYEVTDSLVIIPLIKQWMPYIKVISPSSIKEQISKDAKFFLKLHKE